jgi:hypothetical protein
VFNLALSSGLLFSAQQAHHQISKITWLHQLQSEGVFAGRISFPAAFFASLW